jgi:hypothetical protein
MRIRKKCVDDVTRVRPSRIKGEAIECQSISCSTNDQPITTHSIIMLSKVRTFSDSSVSVKSETDKHFNLNLATFHNQF